MDPLCQYRVTDIYLTAALSIAAVSLFVCLKPRAPWSEERYLRALVLGWALLQIVALILSSIQDSNKVEFPQAIAVSIHVILATISLWGIAIVQIIAIIYTFAVVYAEESWWKMAVIVECVEVGIVLFFAPIQEISTPIELAYMTPLTSQALAIIVIYLASRRSFPNKAPRHTADHLLSAGLFVIIAFAAVLGLSLAGFLPRLLVIQWFIFVSVLTVGYRLPERLDRPHELDGLESDTQLTRRLRSRWFGRDSPRRESYRSLSGAEPLPPPDAHLPR